MHREGKVSFAIPLLSLKWHGGVRVLVDLANVLSEKGHRIFIITPKNRYHKYYRLQPSVKLILTPTCGKIPFISHLYALFLILLKTPPVDYVIANFYPTFYIALLHSLLYKSKIIYYVMDYETQFGPFPYSLIADITYQFKNYIKFTVSEWVKQKTGGWGYILHPPLDESFFRPITEKKEKVFTVIYVYRRSRRKGPELFESIVSSHKLKDVRFWIVGEKPSLETPNLQYLGVKKTEELIKLYERSHLLLNTSHFEGFGLPPLEAMARGTPPVLTDSGGVREYAVHNYNAIIANTVKEFEEAILRLKHDTDFYNYLKKNGIETSKGFTKQNFINQFLSLLSLKK